MTARNSDDLIAVMARSPDKVRFGGRRRAALSCPLIVVVDRRLKDPPRHVGKRPTFGRCPMLDLVPQRRRHPQNNLLIALFGFHAFNLIASHFPATHRATLADLRD